MDYETKIKVQSAGQMIDRYDQVRRSKLNAQLVETHEQGLKLAEKLSRNEKKYKDLKSIENVVPIVSILQQLGYLQLISPNDFQLLKENYHGITRDQSDEYNNPICELDEYICLLRYRVELYLRNNTAEIAMNFTPFSDETEKAEGETE